MASSFDTEQVSQADRVYGEVMALYAAIKDTPGAIRVKRAEMRQGEVQAEPLETAISLIPINKDSPSTYEKLMFKLFGNRCSMVPLM